MPASYAHYRFGKLLLPQMRPQERQRVQCFRRLYDIGLQGPDFFFYYNPAAATAIGKLGSQIHRQSGQDFFTRCLPAASTEGARAYLYGLLAHYCLDSVCHPYVNRLDAAGEAGHAALEAEFDRYLMALDGIDRPHRHEVTRHMRLTRGESETVASFYPPATGGAVRQSVGVMTFCLRFFAGGNRTARLALLRRIAPAYCGLFVPDRPAAAFAPMDRELMDRFQSCLDRYPRLLDQLEACRTAGTPLGEAFAPNFG